jgi:hypothetical protein
MHTGTDADTMEAAIQRAVAAFSPEELAEGFRNGVNVLWNTAGIDAVVRHGKAACAHPPAAAKLLAGVLERHKEFQKLEFGPVVAVFRDARCTIWYFLVRDSSLSLAEDFNSFECWVRGLNSVPKFKLLGDPKFGYNNVLRVAEGPMIYDEVAFMYFWSKDAPEPFWFDHVVQLAALKDIEFPDKFKMFAYWSSPGQPAWFPAWSSPAQAAWIAACVTKHG